MVHNEKVIHISSLAETHHLAEKIARLLKGGDVITLSGDLGAGKTSFTQGLAKGLGVKRNVNSPTFTIIKEYQGTHFPFYHMDTYRLDDQFEELGLEEYFYGDGISVIEWPQMIENQLPSERLDITIRKTGDESREFILSPQGNRYKQLVDEVVI